MIGVFLHFGNALFAASTAALNSSPVVNGTLDTTSCVAGLMTSMEASDRDSRNFPPMRFLTVRSGFPAIGEASAEAEKRERRWRVQGWRLSARRDEDRNILGEGSRNWSRSGMGLEKGKSEAANLWR